MIQTIRVKTIQGPDLRGNGVLHDIKTFLKFNTIRKIETTRVYRLEGVTQQQADRLAKTLFSESLNQTYTLNKKLINGANHILEIAYRPGVMNPEVTSILKTANDLKISLLAADSSTEYGFYGKISRKELQEIVKKLNLYNPLIEYPVAKEPTTLLLKGRAGKTKIIEIRHMSGDALMKLSKDTLFLNLEEMKVIQNYFRKIKRDPTDCEIETLAQTWSEHSGHKTFKAKLIVDGKEKKPLFSRLMKESLKHDKHIVSAFVDNSGVMDFYDGFAVCGKAETHNSPSAIEPYGGAMTGSGGVFRDVVATGLGAKAIASTDIFCFAPPQMDLKKLPLGCHPPDYLLKRCVTAVKDYGNRVGIPTNNGSFHFHDDFRAKPTVLVGSYGILPKKLAQKGMPKIGDVVVSVGGRIGRDGIHGATFSSGEMTDRTISVNAQAVQIGNAIEEKRMFDAILEARDKNLIRVIQDSGGGGLSSAVGEIGETTGVTIQLKNERLKYQGLSPWEIWVSESQERIILAIPKNKLKEFKNVCKKYNVEISVLGKFDGSKKLQVYYGAKKVCDLSMEFLHHGLPQRKMVARGPKGALRVVRKTVSSPKSNLEWISVFKKILSHPNICSKESIVRLYDHSVQGTNDLQPYSGVHMDGPNDAAIIRPLLDKPYGMIVAHGLNPVLNNYDPYWGSIWAATEALANYTAVGGNYKEASLINNYVWPFPDEESLWSLDKSVDAVVDFMKDMKTPVISGKDSLSSTYRGKDGNILKIPPVLCISVFGRIKDSTKTTTSDFKKENSVLCLVGKMDFVNMGGSLYNELQKINGDIIPRIDLKLLPKVFTSIYNGIQKQKILACHDISEGGPLAAIFEMCVGGDIGAHLNVILNETKNLNPINFLFNETAGCFIVEVENKKIANQLFNSIPFIIIGKTHKEKSVLVENGKKKLFSADLYDLKKFWQLPMQKYFS